MTFEWLHGETRGKENDSTGDWICKDMECKVLITEVRQVAGGKRMAQIAREKIVGISNSL